MELLVVLAIIALLAALLLASLAQTRATAQSAVCKSNLRQLGISLQIFRSENHYYPVTPFQTKPLSPPNSGRLWFCQFGARWTWHLPAFDEFPARRSVALPISPMERHAQKPRPQPIY